MRFQRFWMDTAEEMWKAMEQGEGLEGELAKVSSCVDHTFYP